jgi:hypothetical protein
MKTDQLISALVADRAAARPLSRGLVLALLAGGVISLGIYFALFGPRPDLAAALQTWRFDLKVAAMLLALGLAFQLCRTLARPVVPPHAARRLLLLLVLAVAAVAVELAAVPKDFWRVRLVGGNALVCLTAIPLFALAPLVAILAALRAGAPTSPLRTGAAAGLLAAASGAALYAFHCTDDSPLFVATWYTLAAIPVIVLGAALGHRLLRW